MKATRHRYALGIGLLFSWLFFERSAGINLLIFDLLLFAAIYHLDREKLQHTTVRVFYAGTLLAAIMVVWHHSGWSVFMHHASFGLLGGALAAPQLKSTLNIAFAGIFNTVLSVRNYFRTRKQVPKEARPRPLARVWYALRISVVPLIIVAIFGTIYSNSSPWFNTFWTSVQAFMRTIFGDLFNMISFTWLFTFIFGLALAIYLLFASSNNHIEDAERNQPEDLNRQRERYRGGIMALKRELHVATLLFIALNLLIFGQNLLDFTHVWIGFEWDGEYLKQFVHEGTYLLIFSIMISASLVVFYFRGNLNFYKNNRLLRGLAIAWIAQNAFLAASVAVRNIWYIQYFNLAYKRIGVFFFLIAVIYGLYTVFVKVNQQKSIYYLIRANALAAYLILLSIGFVNWDKVIARYNFAHAQDAYVHLSFLSKLDNSALPHLEHDLAFLETIQYEQEEVYGRDKYAITPEDYADRIAFKKERFIAAYPRRHWLEWNYDDWNAYAKLIKQDH